MATVYKFGPFRLDTEVEILFRGAEPTALGQRAVALLRPLLDQPGAPVAKDALIEAAWPGLAVEESNLTVQIAALRRVFAEETGGERWIETLARRGYRYVGPAVAVENAGPAAAPLAQVAPEKPSIAVLPFANVSGDPDQEYFADGMAEDIITALSRFRWFLVIARNSSFIYKGRTVDVREIGRELGVRYLLEGSVRKGGNRLRITAQLVEAETGSHLWAEKYDGSLDDVFNLQDHIAEGVVSAIEPSIRRAEIERARRKRPENLDAYDLYLRALPHAWAFSPDEMAEAIPLLEEALRLDPGYAAALAYSGLVVGMLGHDFDIACNAVEKALALNPNSAQAFSLGAALYSFVGRFDTVIDYAKRSVRLSPFDPLSYVGLNALARAHYLSARYDEAIEAALRATQANPRFAPAYVWLVASHVKLGRMPQAVEARQRMLTFDPNFRFSRWAGFTIAPGEQQEAIAGPLRAAGVPE